MNKEKVNELLNSNLIRDFESEQCEFSLIRNDIIGYVHDEPYIDDGIAELLSPLKSFIHCLFNDIPIGDIDKVVDSSSWVDFDLLDKYVSSCEFINLDPSNEDGSHLKIPQRITFELIYSSMELIVTWQRVPTNELIDGLSQVTRTKFNIDILSDKPLEEVIIEEYVNKINEPGIINNPRVNKGRIS